MEKVFAALQVDQDGWLWFGKRRLPCKFTPMGLEFCERGRRAVKNGGQFYIVPLEALLALAVLKDYQDKSIERDGEQP